MAVSDYTDPVVGFSDETSAQVFAKFVALQGVPCHIVQVPHWTHSNRFGVHVERRRVDQLKNILRLTIVVSSVTPAEAQSIARQLTSAGIPCYAGSPTNSLLDDAHQTPGPTGTGFLVAVPEPFSVGAFGILGKQPPPDFEARLMARVESEDPKHPY
jgi:hypothetical protein